MFKSILIATDGYPLSGKAVTETLELARALGARVAAITVVEPYAVMAAYHERVEDVAAAIDRHRKNASLHAERVLDGAVAAARAAGLECERIQVEHSSPWQAIVDIAKERGFDLIAMASHGRGGIQALLVGSETQKVLTHSSVPVLVYR